jgi:hypothetical protein
MGKINRTTQWISDTLESVGRVIFYAENATTPSGTAAKVLTVDEGYTPADGDILLVIWTIANSTNAPTFNINGTVYQIWFGGDVINSSAPGGAQFTIAQNSRTLYVFQNGRFHQIGSNLKAVSDIIGIIYAGTAGRQFAQDVPGYNYVMEGADGKFYPLHTGGYTTESTKPVNTAEFKMGGLIIWVNATSTTPAGATTSSNNRISDSVSSAWNTYGLNGSSHLTPNRMCYLKGSINENGNFVLDNSSFTSFYTSELPTTDDGFVYIEFIRVGTTNTRMWLPMTHDAWWFKDGQIRPYGVRKHSFDSLDDKPTTLSGYGITDGYTKTEVNIKIEDEIEAIPIANAENPGLMAKEDVSQLQTNTTDIAALKGRALRYPTHLDTQTPTDAQLSDVITAGGGTVSDGVTVVDLTYNKEYTYFVADASWHDRGNATVGQATNSTSGTVTGDELTPGKVYVEVDGTMSVNGWDATQQAIAGKINSVPDKDLSTNDYTDDEKEKLAGIEAEAQKNVPIKHKSTAIDVESWEGTESPYTCQVTDADIVDGCLVECIPAVASQDIADAAQIYADLQPVTGAFTLTAKNKPTEAITIKYTIEL